MDIAPPKLQVPMEEVDAPSLSAARRSSGLPVSTQPTARRGEPVRPKPNKDSNTAKQVEVCKNNIESDIEKLDASKARPSLASPEARREVPRQMYFCSGDKLSMWPMANVDSGRPGQAYDCKTGDEPKCKGSGATAKTSDRAKAQTDEVSPSLAGFRIAEEDPESTTSNTDGADSVLATPMSSKRLPT